MVENGLGGLVVVRSTFPRWNEGMDSLKLAYLEVWLVIRVFGVIVSSNSGGCLLGDGCLLVLLIQFF